MKILIIEDDELKYNHLKEFITSILSPLKLTWKKSYQSGLDEIFEETYDLILLDMSMHVYEKNANESGGSFETYAGRMILSEIDMNEIETKVIVVTGYDVFGDGKTLGILKSQLRNEFDDFYIDTVYFIGSENKWKNELETLINNNF